MATVASLPHVLHRGQQTNPGMHALLVHGERRRRKARFGECSDRNCDIFFMSLARIVHRGTALRAEMECGSASFVTGADVGGRVATDLYCALEEPRLRAEHASSSALTGQAMTDGDANGLLAHRETKLATTTGGGTDWHVFGSVSCSSVAWRRKRKLGSIRPLLRRHDQVKLLYRNGGVALTLDSNIDKFARTTKNILDEVPPHSEEAFARGDRTEGNVTRWCREWRHETFCLHSVFPGYLRHRSFCEVIYRALDRTFSVRRACIFPRFGRYERNFAIGPTAFDRVLREVEGPRRREL